MPNEVIVYPTLIEIGQEISGNITFTPEQFFAAKNAIFFNAMIFGYVACIVGFVMGIYVGWSWCNARHKRMEKYK
jgi:hypothetical protein